MRFEGREGEIQGGRRRGGWGGEERACPVCSLKGWLHRSIPSLRAIYILHKCCLWFVVSLTREKLHWLSNYDNKRDLKKKTTQLCIHLEVKGQTLPGSSIGSSPARMEKRKVANLRNSNNTNQIQKKTNCEVGKQSGDVLRSTDQRVSSM